jgi:hypothetical protein
MMSPARTGRCDPGLIEAARCGDEKALVSLIAAVQPDVRRYAARNCRAADIDDAVQETLLLLYRRLGTLRAGNMAPARIVAGRKTEPARCRNIVASGGRVYRLEKFKRDREDIHVPAVRTPASA